MGRWLRLSKHRGALSTSTQQTGGSQTQGSIDDLQFYELWDCARDGGECCLGAWDTMCAAFADARPSPWQGDGRCRDYPAERIVEM